MMLKETEAERIREGREEARNIGRYQILLILECHGHYQSLSTVFSNTDSRHCGVICIRELIIDFHRYVLESELVSSSRDKHNIIKSGQLNLTK